MLENDSVKIEITGDEQLVMSVVSFLSLNLSIKDDIVSVKEISDVAYDKHGRLAFGKLGNIRARIIVDGYWEDEDGDRIELDEEDVTLHVIRAFD